MVETNKIKEKFKNGKNFIKAKFNSFSTEMKKRVLSAIILVPIVLFLISIKSLFLILMLSLAVLISFEWITIINTKYSNSLIWKIYGLLYVLIPITSLIYIRNSNKGFDIILWICLVVWATDIAGMLVGKTFGGPKLAPTISPNKTWSGLLGGVIASAFIGILVSFVFKGNMLFFIVFSSFLACVEQCGDLLESKVKRIFDVKDSGNIIPGHGGIMDRVDGFTIVAPLVALFVLFSSNIF